MMDNKEPMTPSSFQRRGNAPLVIPQLLQASTGMKHIDEMLQWLANVVVQRLDVQVMQFWSYQVSSTGQLSPALRINACEDTSLPPYMLYNPQIVEIVERSLRLRQSIPFQPVNGVFSPHQASLFLRYGLHSCLGYFLSVDALLPPAQNRPHLASATPCTILALLVLRHDLSQEAFAAMQHIFEQTILIAARRGLLLPPNAQDMRSAAHTSYALQQPPLSLLQIVPHRLSNTEAMKADNPFAAAVPAPVIKDRTALRLYQAIDGKKTVSDLAAVTRLKENDVIIVLKILLKEKLIQLFTTEGRPLDGF